MATNPRIPHEQSESRRKRPEIVPKTGRMVPKRPGSGMGGAALAIIIALALLAAVLYYLPRSPHQRPAPSASQVPVQPNNSQLQLSGLQMSMEPTGAALYLDGRLTNHGPRPITGAVFEVKLRDNNGRIVEHYQRPMQGISSVKGENEFTKRPIKPNETRFFRVTVSPLPASWNHEMPEMQAIMVTAE